MCWRGRFCKAGVLLCSLQPAASHGSKICKDMYSWACKPMAILLHSRTDRLSVQDGDGYILIDAPDENFTEAYGVLLTSTSFSVPMCPQSTGHHHAYLRAIMIAACAVTECIKSVACNVVQSVTLQYCRLPVNIMSVCSGCSEGEGGSEEH